MNSKITSRSTIIHSILSSLLFFVCFSESIISIEAQFLADFSSKDNNNYYYYNREEQLPTIDYYIQEAGIRPSIREGKGGAAHLQQELSAIDNSILPTSIYYNIPQSTKDLPSPSLLVDTDASLLEYFKQLKDENNHANIVIEEPTTFESFDNIIEPRALAHGYDVNNEGYNNLLSINSNDISDPINIPADLAIETEVDSVTDSNHTIKSELLDPLFAVYVNKVLQKLQYNQNLNKQLELQQQQASIRRSDDHDFGTGFNLIVEENEDQNDSDNDSEGDLTTSYGGGSEYIDHPLALAGHQYVQGGAGEGRQLLGPEGTFENVQVVKSDHAITSYCNPPNPCPIGYTAEDGCLEKFVNSASFSREYQAKQKCSCDNEHSLFNCAAPSLENQNNNDIEYMNTLMGGASNYHEQQQSLVDHKLATLDNNSNDIKDEGGGDKNRLNKLDTLARTIQNRFGQLPSVRNLINNSFDKQKMQTFSQTDNNNNIRVYKRT